MKWWSGSKVRIENGIKLNSICEYYPLYSGKRRSIFQALIFGFACLKLIKEDFDIADVDSMPHFPVLSMKLICFIKRRRMIVVWHEAWDRSYWVKYLGWKGIFGYLLERISGFLSSEIVSVSEHTKNKLRDSLKSKKIYTIPDGNDSKKIYKINPAMKKSDIIFAGRLLSNKNVDILIRSLRLIRERIPEVRCFIVGDGPERKDLEALIQELSLKKNIMFLGFLENQDEVYALMKSSKVFVLPSTREGFGIVVIEANACGIPVITIDHENNAAKDLIEDGRNGFVCQLDDREIAQKIIEVLENDLSEKMKETCINLAGKYDWDRIVDEVERVYKAC
jgi:glycosyltransferase involved in cell wall biosynthesis